MFDKILKLFKKEPNPVLANRLILFIDDSEIDRKVVEKILTKRNFRVILSVDGETGLETARKEKPDLVLLDISLPGINGIEVCKRLKKDDTTKHIPVIFLTGMDTPKNLIDCYEYGAEDFLNKNIPPKLLIKQIELTLQEHDATTSG